jgi:hypothetical protein
MTDKIKNLISTSERLRAESFRLNSDITQLTAELIYLRYFGGQLRDLSNKLMADNKQLYGNIAKVQGAGGSPIDK